MFTILKDYYGRLKFVNNTTGLEIVPRCSPSVLLLVVEEIYKLAFTHRMKPNPKNVRKEMIIISLHYVFQLVNLF